MHVLAGEYLHTVTYIFYTMSLSLCSALMAACGCFENLTVTTFSFTPVHVSRCIRETNTRVKFLGMFEYPVCSSEHFLSARAQHLQSHEKIEHLRILHEKLTTIINDTNQCFNPQFLLFLVAELTVLVINCYSVVIYFVRGVSNPVIDTYNFLNCQFVFLHTFGLYMFLRRSQILGDMVSEVLLFDLCLCVVTKLPLGFFPLCGFLLIGVLLLLSEVLLVGAGLVEYLD